MTWLWLAFLTSIIGSLIAVTDKIVIERFLRDRLSFPFFVATVTGLYAISLLAVRSALGLFRMPPVSILAVAIMPGIFQYAGSFLYTRALLQANAATVAALNQAAPLFALFWGWAFLGDVFTPLSYLGIFVIVSSCILLSLELAPGAKSLKFNPAFWLVVGGAMLRSLSDLFVKLTLTNEDYWNTFGLGRSVLLVLSLLILLRPSYRQIIGNSIRVNGLRVVPAMAIYEIIALQPVFLGVIAYSLGPLALVSTVLYTTPLFVLVFTLFFNRVHPGLVPERTGQSLLTRVVLTAGVVAGVILLRS
jgi:uncharacterized membrane protein